VSLRTATRVLAAVLAVALMAGGLLGVIEIVLAASGRDPWLVPGDRWYRNLRTTPWRDDGVVVAGVIVLAAGQALAVPALGVLALRRVPEARHGAAAGLFFAWFDAGVGLGGPVSGLLAHLAGPSGALAGAAVAVAATAPVALRGSAVAHTSRPT
jgi:hypothetical protein